MQVVPESPGGAFWEGMRPGVAHAPTLYASGVRMLEPEVALSMETISLDEADEAFRVYFSDVGWENDPENADLFNRLGDLLRRFPGDTTIFDVYRTGDAEVWAVEWYEWAHGVPVRYLQN